MNALPSDPQRSRGQSGDLYRCAHAAGAARRSFVTHGAELQGRRRHRARSPDSRAPSAGISARSVRGNSRRVQHSRRDRRYLSRRPIPTRYEWNFLATRSNRFASSIPPPRSPPTRSDERVGPAGPRIDRPGDAPDALAPLAGRCRMACPGCLWRRWTASSTISTSRRCSCWINRHALKAIPARISGKPSKTAISVTKIGGPHPYPVAGPAVCHLGRILTVTRTDYATLALEPVTASR